MSDLERIRLVTLGGAGVGKSCIVKRFILNTYTDKYRSTVEDLYNREYDLGNVTLKVDILDTAGDLQFPAMRRLSIANAHAFLLVYACTSHASFENVKMCFEEIREQRSDFQEIPIVIAGNKYDLANTHREVKIEDVNEWVYCELPKLRVKVMECSAKENYNIKEVFRAFLNLSHILVTNSTEGLGGPLKRRSSAYVSVTKSGRNGGASSSVERPITNEKSIETHTESKLKPRSRSLIRRSSRKAKQQIRDAQNNSEECIVT